jgi:hypothetical protein
MIQEDRHMRIISEKTYSEQSSIKTVSNFFQHYQVGKALKGANAYKQKGIAVTVIMKYLVSLIYTGKSMFQDMRSPEPLAAGFCKDTVYRLLNMTAVNWQRFLFKVASKVVAEIDSLTSLERLDAFVVDDTMYPVAYAKKTELVSKVYDHAEKGKNKYKWGFRMLTLAWTDGVSLIPVAFRHLASSDEKKQRYGPADNLDRRSCAYRTRKEAVSKAADVLLMMLKAALYAGISTKYVLFDAWFSYPVTIIKINALRLHVVGRVKDTTKLKYIIKGEKKTARQIFKENRKRRGKSRYLLSVDVALYSEENKEIVSIPAKLVYVRNRQKRNAWIAIVCTDTSLNEDDIIALYGKRWDIEVFFKICKSYLKLTGEFQQLSYGALIAGTTIVMLRYMILSVEKRKSEDKRSLGSIFFDCCDEAADIRFEQALIMIMLLLAETLKEEALGLTEAQMNMFMDSFIVKLPPSIQACLVPGHAA